MRLIDADKLKGKAFANPDDGEHFVYCQGQIARTLTRPQPWMPCRLSDAGSAGIMRHPVQPRPSASIQVE